MRILVMMDFSESAKRALAFARNHFPAAELKLLHIVSIMGLSEMESGRTMGGAVAASLVKTQPDLKREAAAQLAELGGGEVAVGHAPDTGLDVATRWGADLIVMGTAGRRGLERLFVGSVAGEMVRRSTVPVLTVRVPTG